MLAQFSIWPLDRPHLSRDVANVTEILDQTGVHYEVGPMSTTLEGEWHEVMNAIHACHETLRSDHQRMVTSITIDDDSTRGLNMSESTAKVQMQREEASS